MNKIMKLKTVRHKLRNIKDELYTTEIAYDFKDMYNKIYEICLNYECETGDCKLLDEVRECSILDEDDLRYYFEKNNKTLPLVREFINNTKQADIYRLNDYGALENVTTGNMLKLCEDLVQIVNDRLKEQEDEMS